MRKLLSHTWHMFHTCHKKLTRMSGNIGECISCAAGTHSATDLTCKKLSRLFGNFPECPETFQTVQKPSRLFGNFPDCPETFPNIWKLSRLFGNFPDCLETFQTYILKVGISGKFRLRSRKPSRLHSTNPNLSTFRMYV